MSEDEPPANGTVHTEGGDFISRDQIIQGDAIAGDKVTGECSVGCRSCSYCLRGWYNQCPNRTETGVLNRDGGFAEYISFPKYFLHKCNNMAYDEAAFIEPTGIALYPTKLAKVCPDDYVAVMGPGPIGLFAVHLIHNVFLQPFG